MEDINCIPTLLSYELSPVDPTANSRDSAMKFVLNLFISDTICSSGFESCTASIWADGGMD
jgi:hypothetical protein